jgi:hypothetical protein
MDRLTTWLPGSLNGACAAGACVCNKGWRGATCAVLDRRAAPSRAKAGICEGGIHARISPHSVLLL